MQYHLFTQSPIDLYFACLYYVALIFKMLWWLTLCVNHLTHIYLQNKFLEVKRFGQKVYIFYFLFFKAWLFLYRENVCFYQQCTRVFISPHFQERTVSLSFVSVTGGKNYIIVFTFAFLLLSLKLSIFFFSIWFHLYEVLQEVKLIHDDRNQNKGLGQR